MRKPKREWYRIHFAENAGEAVTGKRIDRQNPDMLARLNVVVRIAKLQVRAARKVLRGQILVEIDGNI